MMSHNKFLIAVISILAVLFTGSARAGTVSQPVFVKVTPSVIAMGTFYAGAQVRVEGYVPLDSEVVLVVRGEEVHEVYNKVGRVGPIWVNTGKVSISGIPSLLMIFSTKPIATCLARAEIDRYQLDAAALKMQIKFKPPQNGGDPIANDFLRLKVGQGSYRLAVGDIQTGAATEDGRPFTLDMTWPKSAPPGNYEVRVYSCRHGKIQEAFSVPLKVVEVGFPAMIASLAQERPATYGILSIVVAIIGGFGIDFLTTRIFKRKMSAH